MNWVALLGLNSLIARWRANVIEAAIAAEDRMVLARMEWAEQKQRLRQLLVLTILVGGLIVVALVMLSMAVLLQFWETEQRVLVGWLVAGAWMLGWGGTLLALLSVVRRASRGFTLTSRVLAQDWRDIKERL